MRIPIINRFTCLKSQLVPTINNLKKQNFGVILDYANENYKNRDRNILEIKNLISKYTNSLIALKFGMEEIPSNWINGLIDKEELDQIISSFQSLISE